VTLCLNSTGSPFQLYFRPLSVGRGGLMHWYQTQGSNWRIISMIISDRLIQCLPTSVPQNIYFFMLSILKLTICFLKLGFYRKLITVLQYFFRLKCTPVLRRLGTYSSWCCVFHLLIRYLIAFHFLTDNILTAWSGDQVCVHSQFIVCKKIKWQLVVFENFKNNSCT